MFIGERERMNVLHPFERNAANTGVAKAFLQCGAPSSHGPSWALCNNHITVPLRLGSGNDVTFDAEGWSVMFDDDDQAIVRCPGHNKAT